MDQALFSFPNYRLFLWDCEWLMKEHLPHIKFEFFKIPNLISCTKWKFNYIIARRETTN